MYRFCVFMIVLGWLVCGVFLVVGVVIFCMMLSCCVRCSIFCRMRGLIWLVLSVLLN